MAIPAGIGRKHGRWLDTVHRQRAPAKAPHAIPLMSNP